jgi:hypothetical protein
MKKIAWLFVAILLFTEFCIAANGSGKINNLRLHSGNCLAAGGVPYHAQSARASGGKELFHHPAECLCQRVEDRR